MRSYLVLLVLFWCTGLNAQVLASVFDLPAEDDVVIGKVQVINSRYEDTMLDIARRYDLGYEEIVAVNPGVDVWLPGEGTRIILPTRFILPPGPRKGIVVNVPEMRLYYYPPAHEGETQQVITYPISIGRQDWSTPVAVTTVTGKTTHPVWTPPDSIRKEYAQAGNPLPASIPPGDDNPLGNYALKLGIPGYLIHGTNRAYGIGLQSTHGCIRLYPEDIEVLYDAIQVGTPVRIINQPYKSGWSNGVLFLEAHPQLNDTGEQPIHNYTPAVEAIVASIPETLSDQVDWETVRAAVLQSDGIPIQITNRLLNK